MITKARQSITLMICLLFYQGATYAWQHEIAVGFGRGQEIEQAYRNQGLILSGKLYRFPNIDETLIATLDATLANITSSTAEHNHLFTIALSPALRAYFSDPLHATVRPYLQASFGPAYLSAKMLGNRSQGSHLVFQTTLEAGVEIGKEQSIDMNWRLMHYCNAGIFHPNQGINLVPVLSIGYLF